jgi:2-iminobutanoate/2-iminopropanoate deaminase
MKQEFSRRQINAPDAPQTTHRRYAQGIEISNGNRTLYISGQIPVETDGARPTEFKGQARLAWRNVERQLAAAGMSLDNLVKVTVFLSGYEYRDENAEIRFEVMGERMVALSTVIVGPYDPDWLIEIEAIAVA